MKNVRLLLILFAAAALLQLAAPLYMAWHWENILRTGQPSYWITAPVDPYDAVKGRYIDLNFKHAYGPLLEPDDLRYGQTAYATIASDQNGRAFISGITAGQPPAAPYVKVKVLYVENSTVHVELPFKRYYLPEDSAPAAESAYRKSAGQTGLAAVRLKDGYGVIEELYIDQQPLADYLRSTAP